MSCEDYDLEDSMKEEQRVLLDLVCPILQHRTDWIAQGQAIMEGIVAEVESHAEREDLAGPRRPAPAPRLLF